MFNWGDLQIVHRFFYEFFRVLGITWLIVVFAAIVTQGRIGQYGTFILPTQFLIALGFGIFKIINGQQQHFNSPDINYSSSDSASKLIDCQDCGTRISRLAAACPTCGRAGQAALKQGTYTKAIFFVISMAISWTIVQFISSIREEGRKDRSIKANLELQRTINDPRATEGDYRRAYEKVLNP